MEPFFNNDELEKQKANIQKIADEVDSATMALLRANEKAIAVSEGLTKSYYAAEKLANVNMSKSMATMINVSHTVSIRLNTISSKMEAVRGKTQGSVAAFKKLTRQANIISKLKISKGMLKFSATLNKVKTRLSSAKDILSKFKGMIDKARGSMEKLKTSSEKAGKLGGTEDAEKYNEEIEKSISNLEKAIEKQNALAAGTQNVQSGMNNVSGTSLDIGINLGKSAGKMGALKAGLSKLGGKAAIVMEALEVIKGIITEIIKIIKKAMEVSDKVALNNIKISNINDGLQTTIQLQKKIFKGAKKSRTAYQDFLDTVLALSKVIGGVFSNNEDAIAFAETASKSFVVGGMNAKEQAEAMKDMTSAMADGVIRGGELNTILTNSPMLAQVLTDQLGASSTKLMEMAENGEVTAGMISAAMSTASDEIETAFAGTPTTFTSLWGSFKDRAMQAFRPILLKFNELANNPRFQLILDGIAEAIETIAPLIYVILDGLLEWFNIGMDIALLYYPFLAFFKANIYSIVVLMFCLIESFRLAKDVIIAFARSIVTGALPTLDDMIGGSISRINRFVSYLNDAFDLGIKGVVDIEDDSRDEIVEQFIGRVKSSKDFTEVTRIDLMNTSPIGSKIDQLANTEKNTSDSSEFDSRGFYKEYIVDGVLFGPNPSDGSAERLRKEKEEMEKNARYQGYSVGGGSSPAAQQTAENTEAIKNSMDTTVEELKYLRDIAEQEAINRFTTAEIKIDMTNNNSINSDLDIDGIVEQLEDKLGAAMASAAEGVA